jgi:hypothetical protein
VGIFLQKIGTFYLLARRLLIIPGISAPQIASFLLKMLITVTTAVTLPFIAASITISSALVVSLGAVVAILIGQGLLEEMIVTNGSSNFRPCLL